MSRGVLKKGLAVLLGSRKPDRSGEFEVVPATARDVDDLFELAETFRSEHSASWGENTLAHWARWQIKGSVQDADHVVLIARAGARAVGYTSGKVDKGPGGTIGKIEAVYVLPGQRGTGLANRLLATALNAMAHRGARDVELVVSAENKRAQAFFREFGFQDGERVMGLALSVDDDGPADSAGERK